MANHVQEYPMKMNAPRAGAAGVPEATPSASPAPGPASAPTSGFETPFCGELRSKKFFMLDVIPSDPSDYLDPSGHCWCFHTQRVTGPDRGIVTPDRCVPGRSCYRSALADEA